ncbi:MAG: SgcJ/EcaC family oxidoreductase [Hyphomicrobiales bacterium]
MTGTPTVDALLAQWIAAFNSHDLDAHMNLYTEDATLFGSVNELKVGREAIRNYFSGRGPNVHVKSYPLPRVAMLGSEIAVTAGYVEFADGDVPLPYRMTWVLVKREGNWRILQHHGSPRSAV